jgi:acetyl esterase/lipase
MTTWLDALRDLDPALALDEISPGLTAGDVLALHDHVDPPPGFRYDPAALYDTRHGLTMHLYAPDLPAPPRPGVLFVHGGGWQGGCATWHLRQACALAEHGYVAASADYRLAPAHRWPAQLEDVTNAVQWLRANAARLALDPERLVIAGTSAGGHIAAFVAVTTNDVAGAILWYPALDLERLAAVEVDVAGIAVETVLDDLLGGHSPALLREASPVTHVTPSCPPVLTLTGATDQLTPAAHMEPFHAALTTAGVDNRLIVVPDRGHQFDLYPGDWEASFSETLDFLAATVGTPS